MLSCGYQRLGRSSYSRRRLQTPSLGRLGEPIERTISLRRSQAASAARRHRQTHTLLELSPKAADAAPAELDRYH
jgi:hypothetical protein